MKTLAVVQARMTSSRLPGKSLATIEGRTMLARVVRRTRRAKRLDKVVVATSDKTEDDEIITECQRLGVEVFRGSLGDVLDRFYRAMRCFGASVVVRLTADCPLIDPGVIDLVVETLNWSGADYASNTLQRSFPRGLDAEAMTAQTLTAAWKSAKRGFERTHVTPYIYQHPEEFELASVTTSPDVSCHRWTVDTVEDLETVRGLYSRFKDDEFDWREVLKIIQKEPGLVLNLSSQQKLLEEG